MNEGEFQKLIETSWRRRLTDAELAALNDHLGERFEDKARWEEETVLNQMLGNLPDAPVSTNFTSRVLQAIDRETDRTISGTSRIWEWVRFNWIPRAALVIFLLAGGAFSVQQHRRAQVARDVAAVSSAAKVPPQWLQDFDAINRLNPPPVDNELLAALQ